MIREQILMVKAVCYRVKISKDGHIEGKSLSSLPMLNLAHVSAIMEGENEEWSTIILGGETLEVKIKTSYLLERYQAYLDKLK